MQRENIYCGRHDLVHITMRVQGETNECGGLLQETLEEDKYVKGATGEMGGFWSEAALMPRSGTPCPAPFESSSRRRPGTIHQVS